MRTELRKKLGIERAIVSFSQRHDIVVAMQRLIDRYDAVTAVR